MKRKKICGINVVRLLAVQVLLLLMSSLAFAQFRNTINGFVFNTERAPVPDIPVELTNEVGQTILRTRTDGGGRYYFSGVSAGRFTVKVLPYGTNYEEQSGEVEIVNFTRGGTTSADSVQKDFHLRTRRGAAGSSGKSLTATVYAQDIPDEAKKLYDKAIAQFDANKASTGVELLMSAVKIFPEYLAALERLGKEFIKQQKYDYSRAAFTKAVSVYDRCFGCWYGLSYSAYASNEPEIARQAAQKALDLDGNSIEALLMLGIAQRHLKLFTEAEETLLRAKKLADPPSADVHWNLALLYANNMGKYKEAAAELEVYLKLAPKDVKTDEIKKLIASLRQKSQGS